MSSALLEQEEGSDDDNVAQESYSQPLGMVTKKSKRKIAITPFGSDIVSQDIAVSDTAVDDAAGVDHSPSPSPFASDDDEDVGEGEEEGEDEEEEIGAMRSYKNISISHMRKKLTVASTVIALPHFDDSHSVYLYSDSS